jgi:hypothetical protein
MVKYPLLFYCVIMGRGKKEEEGCCHDYDEAWVCKICGYQLPAAVQKKIRLVGEEGRET